MPEIVLNQGCCLLRKNDTDTSHTWSFLRKKQNYQKMMRMMMKMRRRMMSMYSCF